MAVLCVVCETPINYGPFDSGTRRRILFACPRCGDFSISFEANDWLRDRLGGHPLQRAVLSHGIRRLRREAGSEPPYVSRDVAMRMLEQQLPTPMEQVDNLLLWLGDASEAGGSGKPVDVAYPFAAGIIGCIDDAGVRWALNALADEGMIHRHDVSRDREVFVQAGESVRESYQAESTVLKLTGWRHYEELKRTRLDSRVAFMAMPFGNTQLDAVFADCFKLAVEKTGFQLQRLMDQQRAGLIDDRLRVEIRRSRFLLCELTDDNRGAYWESGFAEGLGRPVIYTCRKDYHPQVHFDTNHYLTVLWDPDALERAAAELKAVIRATLPTEAKLSDE